MNFWIEGNSKLKLGAEFVQKEASGFVNAKKLYMEVFIHGDWVKFYPAEKRSEPLLRSLIVDSYEHEELGEGGDFNESWRKQK
jgi:hypothetical protein